MIDFQVYSRLSQLLRSQLSISTEEMNRWCQNKSKDQEACEEMEQTVSQEDSTECLKDQSAEDGQAETSESVEDVHAEESVVPEMFEGRGSMKMDLYLKFIIEIIFDFK